MTPRKGMPSPWGQVDSIEQIGEGIWWVGTPSHGGLLVDLDQHPDAASALEGRTCSHRWDRAGWWEEDMDYAYAVLACPAVAAAMAASRYANGPQGFGRYPWTVEEQVADARRIVATAERWAAERKAESVGPSPL